jgi:hypothetical protein
MDLYLRPPDGLLMTINWDLTPFMLIKDLLKKDIEFIEMAR